MVAGLALEVRKQHEEGLAHLLDVADWVSLVEFARLLEPVVGLVFRFLCLVHCFLLADRPVEVYVFLLERIHRNRDFLHELRRVLQRLVLLVEHFVLKHHEVVSAHDLRLQRRQIAQRHVEEHAIFHLAIEEE